jgi:putative DNA primase/helicase
MTNLLESDEMTRRTVRIRLDSGMERPEQRKAFRHPNLLAWAREHRGELIWAALTLARAWVANGRPAGPEKPLGSFEQWTHVIGGILHIADIQGLLANAAELRAESQDTTHADLLQAVYAAKGDGDFSSADIMSIATPIVGLGDVSDQVAAQRLGTRLRDMVDRPISGLVLRRGANPHGSRRWRVASLAAPPPQPIPTPNAASDGSGGVVGVIQTRRRPRTACSPNSHTSNGSSTGELAASSTGARPKPARRRSPSSRPTNCSRPSRLRSSSRPTSTARPR